MHGHKQTNNRPQLHKSSSSRIRMQLRPSGFGRHQHSDSSCLVGMAALRILTVGMQRRLVSTVAQYGVLSPVVAAAPSRSGISRSHCLPFRISLCEGTRQYGIDCVSVMGRQRARLGPTSAYRIFHSGACNNDKSGGSSGGDGSGSCGSQCKSSAKKQSATETPTAMSWWSDGESFVYLRTTSIPLETIVCPPLTVATNCLFLGTVLMEAIRLTYTHACIQSACPARMQSRVSTMLFTYTHQIFTYTRLPSTTARSQCLAAICPQHQVVSNRVLGRRVRDARGVFALGYCRGRSLLHQRSADILRTAGAPCCQRPGNERHIGVVGTTCLDVTVAWVLAGFHRVVKRPKHGYRLLSTANLHLRGP